MMVRIKYIYNRLYSFLPKKLKGLTTKGLYKVRIKPTVNIKAKSLFRKGIVVLSADFEMAWAFRISKIVKNAPARGLRERENMPVILQHLDKYKIPVTWATVGHLFLERCKREKGKAHLDMPRPGYFENRNWSFQQGDWYDDDPCTNFMDDAAWYAPDLIDMILNSKQDHEIGCHTFSHIDFTYQNCSPALAEAEIKKCKELAELKGVSLKSIVFPGGTEGNFETLKKLGFTNYRKPMLYDIDMPKIDQYGLVAIPSSYGMDKPPYGWHEKTCFKIVKSLIDKAAKHKMVCHLWFHPSMDQWYLEKVFPKMLQYLSERRELGLIEVLTMAQIAERTLSN